jgi:hypothetical protein
MIRKKVQRKVHGPTQHLLKGLIEPSKSVFSGFHVKSGLPEIDVLDRNALCPSVSKPVSVPHNFRTRTGNYGGINTQLVAYSPGQLNNRGPSAIINVVNSWFRN